MSSAPRPLRRLRPRRWISAGASCRRCSSAIRTAPASSTASAYTEGKLRAIAAQLGFVASQLSRVFNKGGQALRADADAMSGNDAMRIFITGIAGFLGSHLAERLIGMGHDVVGCDSLLGGELINVPPEAEFYQYDCRDFNAMAKVMRGCELVYHCAATAYEGLSVFAPAMIMDNIVTGSVSVFSAAIADGARRIVFCSSMARYGTNRCRSWKPTNRAHRTRTASPRSRRSGRCATSPACTGWNTPSPCRTTSSARGRNSTIRTATSPRIMANLMLQGRSAVHLWGRRAAALLQPCRGLPVLPAGDGTDRNAVWARW